MSATTVHAQGQKRGNLHRLRIAGANPAQWGPVPYEQSLEELRRYVLRHGFPVQLDTTHEDGSIWSKGFSPDGIVHEIGQVREPSHREAGGLGAAFIPTPPPAGPAAAPVAPSHRVDTTQLSPSRRNAGQPSPAGPADVYGPDVKSSTWSQPLPDLGTISLDTPAEEPPPARQPKPGSRRARREREQQQQPDSPPEPPAEPTRSTLPPLDAGKPTGFKARASSWARNLNTGSLVGGGAGLALTGAGVYFLYETGVLPL